jgi:hypothetical protein
MRHFKAAVSFLFIILLSGNTANAQFGTYYRPREIWLFNNNAPTEYQSRRFAYFENGFFEAQTYRIEGDSNLHSQYVFNGKLSPRLIDDSYFKNLIQNEPTCDRQFICDEKWQFNIVQVRYLQGNWNGFKNIRTGEISNENANQFGGFLICAKDSGIFVSPGSGIYYIPYTYIKNIRRGTSFGEFVSNQTARRRRTVFSRPSYDMSETLMWIPIAAIIYNVSGLFPNKVARFNGDPRGKEFAMNIGKIGAYENSSHATTDFPLALLNIKRNIFSSVHRSLLPPQNIDSLELIADQVQLKVVPHYQDYQLKIRNTQTVISLAPENAAITPSLPHVNEFNNSQGEMPILWAIEQFQPLDVSLKLFKTFPKTQKELLTSGQIEQLTKSADIQMLAIHILTGNGLDFSRLFQFTDEQAIKLNRTITIDAVEAQLGTMLRVIDIPTIEYKNLTMLYQRLNQIMKK